MQRGRIALIAVLIGLVVAGLLVMQLWRGGEREERGKEKLFLYSGAGLRLAVNECVDVFSKEFNAEMEVNYAGSGVLLNQVQMTKKGDLFMPGDVSYVDRVKPASLVESKRTVCYFIPVILVRKDNPKDIQGIRDLVKPGIALGLGDPEVSAIGRTSVRILEKNNMDMEAIKKNLVFSSLTVGELGVQIQLGKIDAAIVWDATAAQYADFGDIVKIPVEKNVISTVAIGLLSSSENKELARKFIELIVSERGQKIFRKYNFSTEL